MTSDSPDRNDLCSRRRFLQVLAGSAALLSPLGALARTANILERIQSVDPDYYGNFLQRFHAWHSREYFDFQAHLTPQENQFLKLARADLRRWTLQLPCEVRLRTCFYTHQILNGKVNSSGLFLLASRKASEAQRLAVEICRKRGIPLSKMGYGGEPIGLRWNLEAEEFEAVLLTDDLSQVKTPEYRALYASHFTGTGPRGGFRSWKLHGSSGKASGARTARRIWTRAPTVVHDSLITRQGVAEATGVYSDGDPTEQWLLLEKFEKGFVNAAGKKIVERHQAEFSLDLHRIDYRDPERFTLFYP